VKLQVDITASNLDDAMEALDVVMTRLAEGDTRGDLRDDGHTGLFELLDSQPAAE
jgi:hypothetical protein